MDNNNIKTAEEQNNTENTDSFLRNVTYFFIPFKTDDASSLCSKLESSGDWTVKKNDTRYLFRYVSDRCSGKHLSINPSALAKVLGKNSLEDEWFTVERDRSTTTERFPEKYRLKDSNFIFLGIELFLFDTNIGIMAFKVHFESDDPKIIASTQFHMKKVASEKFYSARDKDKKQEERVERTFCELAEGVIPKLKDNMFYFIKDGRDKRANMLSFYSFEKDIKDVPESEYKEAVYYMRNAYNQGFLYDENSDNPAEFYSMVSDTVWGITKENCVCAVFPNERRENFLHTVFFGNFNSYYLFMYVLLLHQKYVLHKFLAEINEGMYSSLEELENYRKQLYTFETNYVFSNVSELPQYQNVYHKIDETFELRQMFEDVREPLKSLAEVRLREEKERRIKEEDAEKKREDRMNKSLFWLAILALFSALVDSWDFFENVADHIHNYYHLPRHIFQYCAIAFIIFVIVKLIYAKIKDRKEEKKNKK